MIDSKYAWLQFIGAAILVILLILSGAAILLHGSDVPDSGIRVTECQAPNGLDRCYIARDSTGQFDIACIGVGNGEPGQAK